MAREIPPFQETNALEIFWDILISLLPIRKLIKQWKDLLIFILFSLFHLSFVLD